MITITENAAKEIRNTLLDTREAKDKVLRVYVEKDCCSGMEYGMALDERKPDDAVVEQEGFKIALDPQAAEVLKDGVVDFLSGPQGTGFQIRSTHVHVGCACKEESHSH